MQYDVQKIILTLDEDKFYQQLLDIQKLYLTERGITRAASILGYSKDDRHYTYADMCRFALKLRENLVSIELLTEMLEKYEKAEKTQKQAKLKKVRKEQEGDTPYFPATSAL